ncbi:MAG: hydroxymethylbilane synthase [Methanomassiliicoccales archaeon]|nr:hydroxymethylbilane synthase [Methanomassiliicoccales archaeon]NYT15578.1 hydroxymethylbilane synthase [Methanomassiliicoccales archaeon]
MIIGTRGSRLALAQTELFVERFKGHFPDEEVEVRIVKTTGDKVTDRPLGSLGGYGAFVKELEQQLLEGNVDVVVNSLKDMPVDSTDGTGICAVLPRGPVEDVILPNIALDDLPPGARVGTSSVRRAAMLLNRRSDLEMVDIRGNVPTRIRKMKEGKYDAIVLARAGLLRLNLEEEYRLLDPQIFVPAPGQGAIAAVCRNGDPIASMVRTVDHPPTSREVDLERKVLRLLGGGCSVPIGILAISTSVAIRMLAAALSPDGRKCVRLDEVLGFEEIEDKLESIVHRLRRGLEI